MRNVSSPVRHRMMSTLPKSVRVHFPTGKACSDRSSGQPAASVAVASRPLISIVRLRWEMSTIDPARPPAGMAASAFSSMISHSSGPSQRAERVPERADRPGSVGKTTPKAALAAPTEAGGTRNEILRARGSGTIEMPAVARLQPSSGSESVATVGSAMETRSFLVDEYGSRHLDLDDAVRHRD